MFTPNSNGLSVSVWRFGHYDTPMDNEMFLQAALWLRKLNLLRGIELRFVLTTPALAWLLQMLTAVQNGGAGVVSRRFELGARFVATLRVSMIGVFDPHLAQLCREAQECEPIWSFGKRFVGAC